MKKSICAMFCWFLIVTSFVLVQPAYAYLDPGSGSMILQLVLGGFAGLAMILKLYWGNLKSFFLGKKDEDYEAADMDPENAGSGDGETQP